MVASWVSPPSRPPPLLLGEAGGQTLRRSWLCPRLSPQARARGKVLLTIVAARGRAMSSMSFVVGFFKGVQGHRSYLVFISLKVMHIHWPELLKWRLT